MKGNDKIRTFEIDQCNQVAYISKTMSRLDQDFDRCIDCFTLGTVCLELDGIQYARSMVLDLF